MPPSEYMYKTSGYSRMLFTNLMIGKRVKKIAC